VGGLPAEGGAVTAPTAIVVPCFDEAARLDPAGLKDLAQLAGAHIVLVDDGSTDGTGTILQGLVDSAPDRFTLLTLPTNVGKGESVRRGLRAALDRGVPVVGYYDADLATPPAEMARLVARMHDRPELAVVIGARVGLLGHQIRRSMVRHYLGRVFATASSLVLGLDVYDTQCGAKVFRDGPALRTALARPFVSRWAFDVELLARLHRGTEGRAGLPTSAFLEVPLREWRDVHGTKIGLSSAARAAADLIRIARSAPKQSAPVSKTDT
jgi:glycosyltransferase involved in cell wall biosynthesis